MLGDRLECMIEWMRYGHMNMCIDIDMMYKYVEKHAQAPLKETLQED